MTHLSRTLLASLALALALSSSSCLKTRAQLRQDEDSDTAASTPKPAEIRDVQPKGEYVIDELKAEITRLTGRLEDLERAQKQSEASKSTDKDKDDLKRLTERVAELERAQEALIAEVKKSGAATAAKEDPDAFARGKKEFIAKNYTQAAETLSAYLKAPNATKAEEATFFRAESLYALKQYKKAILDYSKFPEKYSSSKRMPQALYKIGLSFEAMGMGEDAKGFYQELVEKFPKSPEAAKARKKGH